MMRPKVNWERGENGQQTIMGEPRDEDYVVTHGQVEGVEAGAAES